MSWASLAILVVLGLLITGFAATASKALQEFSRRELEVYSRRRQNTERFRAVLEDHEQAALGLESLQIVGTVVLVLSIASEAVGSEGAALGVWQYLVTAAIGTLLLLAVMTWIPEAILRLWSTPFIYHSWPLLKAITRMMWPLTLGVQIMGALLGRLANRPVKQDDEDAFEDEIRSIVTEGLYDGVLEEEEREMIEGVIELGDTDVSDIMTPRSNVDAVAADLGWHELMSFVIQAGRTRLPVFKATLDSVVGVLYVKDLLKELSRPADQRKPLAELLREPCFVPATKPLDEMLQEFLATRNHLAIVVDEYRSVAGVVTIEDVLEEIVGEIVDESDKELEEDFRQIDEQTADVLGTIHVGVVNERLGLELPDPDEYDTVAGLVIAHFGRIPRAGEAALIDGARFTVLEGSRRRVERLRIQLATERATQAIKSQNGGSGD